MVRDSKKCILQHVSRPAGTIEDRLSHYCQLLTVEIWQSLYCPANVLKPWAAFQVLIMCVIWLFLCVRIWRVFVLFHPYTGPPDVHARECKLHILRGWHTCLHALMCVCDVFVCVRRWVCTCACAPVCVRVHLRAVAGMSADVPSNPAVGLLWISSRLQGMGILFPFTALPGRKKGKDAFSLLPSHRLEPEGVCMCVFVVGMMCVCGCWMDAGELSSCLSFFLY